MEHLISEYGSTAFVTVISYFILLFAEDLLGIHKVGRAVYALIIGVLYYNFGASVGPAIQSVLDVIGLKAGGGTGFKGFK